MRLKSESPYAWRLQASLASVTAAIHLNLHFPVVVAILTTVAKRRRHCMFRPVVQAVARLAENERIRALLVSSESVSLLLPAELLGALATHVNSKIDICRGPKVETTLGVRLGFELKSRWVCVHLAEFVPANFKIGTIGFLKAQNLPIVVLSRLVDGQLVGWPILNQSPRAFRLGVVYHQLYLLGKVLFV